MSSEVIQHQSKWMNSIDIFFYIIKLNYSTYKLRQIALIIKYVYDNYTDKMNLRSFQATVVSILLYGCTTRTLPKRLEKKLDSNCTRILRAILNKSRRQHPTKHKLYGHLPPITRTIQVRWTGHAGHCWRSRDELICDVLL